MLHIALDTSILHQEGLGSRNMKMLKRLAIAKELQIYIPEIVHREFISHCEEDARASLTKSINALSDLRRKLGIDNEARSALTRLIASAEEFDRKLKKTVTRDFERWAYLSNVDLTAFPPEEITAVLDDYFSGSGPFKKPKHRPDIPDALIGKSIASLLKRENRIFVAVRDSLLRTHLQTIDGLVVHEELKGFLECQEVVDVINRLDASDNVAVDLKIYLTSEKFSHHLRTTLQARDYLVDQVYVAQNDISNIDAFGIDVSSASISYVYASEIGDIVLSDAVSFGPGSYSIGISFETMAIVHFSARSSDLLKLSEERQGQIDGVGMDGEDFCDFREPWKVRLYGELQFDFDGNLDAAQLSNAIDDPKIGFSNISLDLKIGLASLHSD